MKQIFKKSILFLMTGVMLLGSIVPTFATVNEKQTVSVNNNAQTEVIYNQESTFGVTVPKKVDLGSDKTTDYTVTVFGDIASDETIFVVPDESFLMKDTNTSNPKADVEALVSQDKTEWKFNDLSTIGNGNILAEDLTAGIWEGKFYFNIKLKNCNISVTATNEAGEDINASASLITGNEKENLLNGLINAGYIKEASEVDTLINVKSDDFDGIAETTFDVSDIAKEGEEVVILHFDETKQEWEYIGKETVDENGLIKGDFTSYSPVAFIKVNSDGSYINNITKWIKYAATLESTTYEPIFEDTITKSSRYFSAYKAAQYDNTAARFNSSTGTWETWTSTWSSMNSNDYYYLYGDYYKYVDHERPRSTAGSQQWYHYGYKYIGNRTIETYIKGEEIEIVTSANQNAYPIDGVQDGFWYIKIN